jgi:hypothetical protein
MTQRISGLSLLLLVVAIVSFYLPWIWHSTAGLTAGARDLAEWTTLHPVSRAQNPALLASLLLRVSFGALAILTAVITFSSKIRWYQSAGGILALWIIVQLLPPVEFLTSASGDINYQQQFIVSIITFIAAGAALVLSVRLPKQQFRAATVSLAALAGVFGLLGLSAGQQLMGSFGVALNLGGGFVLYIASLVLVAVLLVLAPQTGLKTQ